MTEEHKGRPDEPEPSSAPRPRAVLWSWPHALNGVVLALPSAIATLFDPQLGIPLAVGVLPAAIIGIRPAVAPGS